MCNRLVMLGQKKGVVWLFDRLDMTIAVDWDVKLKTTVVLLHVLNVRKTAMIMNRLNQVLYRSQDTKWKNNKITL